MLESVVKSKVVKELEKIVGSDFVSTHETDLYIYSQDMTQAEPSWPDVVVLPKSVDEVQAIIGLANKKKIPVTPYVSGGNIGGLTILLNDPCHLGRHLSPGIYEPPRTILKSLPGIELLEMERNRENAWCCGAGGGVKEVNPDLSLWTANERLKEAKATGAQALVTSCPWCERNFKDAIQQYGEEIEIYDIAEITRKAI